MSSIRTRFAPSPTGFMHVGNVRTGLYAWLFARKYGGDFVLRIEDTDKEREVEGAIGHIMESLKWLGLLWDEGPDSGGPHGPYIQSARLPLYKKYAEQLIEAGFAYPDPYTEEELAAFRLQAETERRPFLFRDHRPEGNREWDGTKPLRFRVPVLKRYAWHDLVRGDLSAGEEALDDFILIKSDGYPTYNFAHIVDDIDMEITHVMRGQEFIASTPKFLSVYDALDIEPPAFATLPPVLGEGGKKKLGKRDGARDVLSYRDEGYLPEALANFLALLGWHPEGDKELLSLEELIASFDLTRVQKGGAQFDEDKLRFINQHWMRELSDDAYRAQLGENALWDTARLAKIVPLLKERAHSFAEAKELLATEFAALFRAPVPAKEVLLAKEPSGTPGATKVHLKAILERLAGLPEAISAEEAKEALMPYADQEGRGAVLWPLRYALSGAERSPDPFMLIHILGTTEARARTAAALAILDE